MVNDEILDTEDNNFFISGYTLGDISEIDEEFILEKQEAGVVAYDGYNFIDSFNSDNFESVFYFTYDLIKEFSLNDLRIICRSLIDKIFEVYSYQIFPSPVFSNFNDVDKFLDFVKFLKFDNTNFLFDLLTDIGMNIKEIVNLRQLNIINSDILINHVENISFKYKYNSFIYDYLISQSRESFIKWLNDIFIEKKSDILLELID